MRPAEAYVPEMKRLALSDHRQPQNHGPQPAHHTAGFVEDNPWGDRQQVMPEAEFTAMLAAGVPFAPRAGAGDGIFQLRLCDPRSDRQQRFGHALPGLYPARADGAARHELDQL